MLPKARIGSKGHFPVLADYLTIRSIIEQLPLGEASAIRGGNEYICIAKCKKK